MKKLNLEKYLSEDQKEYIDLQLKNPVPVEETDIPFLAGLIGEPPAIVLEYISNKYDIKFNMHYMDWKNQYPRFSYYPAYLHQFVYSKEIEVDIDTIRGYIIHHSDEDRQNWEFNNLFLMLDKAMHRILHSQKPKDIEKWVKEYINKLLEELEQDRQQALTSKELQEIELQEGKIRQYLRLVARQLKKQKKLLSVLPTHESN